MKQKLQNRSDRKGLTGRSGRRGRRPSGSAACNSVATIRRGLDAKEERQKIVSAQRLQHAMTREAAKREGYAVVSAEHADLIHALGGPSYTPVATFDGVSVRREDLLCVMDRDIVELIATIGGRPEIQEQKLKRETIIMLAVEEWKVRNK